MSKADEILKALTALLEEGAKILTEGQIDKATLGELAPRYESWYTRALAAVTQIIPERGDDFRDAYRADRRKEITYATYTVSDYLTGLVISRLGQPIFDTKGAFATKMLRQVGILQAALVAAPSVLRDIRTTLRAELLDSDVEAAKELKKAGHLRSAGVVCGVALEAHLGSVAERHGLAIRKKNPAISDYNDALKSANVYDVPTWRLIQRLGDIRNLCGHKKDRDPTPDELDDLIAGTEKITKEIF